MVAVSRRSVMTLFSSPSCLHSHRVRLILAEKGISAEIILVSGDDRPEDLVDLNPYGTLPTLVDRDLALYDAGLITEYLDERFPHPPLMPVDPVSRAKARLVVYRVEKDWYAPLMRIEEGGARAEVNAARRELTDSLVASNELFASMPFFLNEEFSVMDCAVAPLLWRLEAANVKLPAEAEAVSEYAERLFARESFQESLTEEERRMRS